MKKIISGALLFVLCLPVLMAVAGDRSNVRGLGMARTVNALARGYDAFGVNPANLSMIDSRTMELGFANFGFRVSSEFLSYDIYERYFTGTPDATGKRVATYLTEKDKNDLLSLLPEDAVRTGFDMEVMLLGISLHHPVLGGLGFGITDRLGMDFDLVRDYARFALFGLDSAGSTYDFSGTGVSAYWWREMNFSYAREVPVRLGPAKSFHVGLSVKLLRGYGIVETDHYNAHFGNAPTGSHQYRLDASFDYLIRRAGSDFVDPDTSVDFAPFPEPGGKGLGFDLGFATVVQGLSLHASVTDIGSITWDRNVVETMSAYSLSIESPFVKVHEDSLELALRGVNREGASFSTSLPTRLRFGASFEDSAITFLRWIPGRMLFAVDYTQGLNKSMGNTTVPRVSAGVEYRVIPILPLRVGLSLGGGYGFRLAGGFGLNLHFLQLDVGTENMGVLFYPSSFNMFSIGARLKILV